MIFELLQLTSFDRIFQKELDQLKSAEQMMNLNNLANSFLSPYHHSRMLDSEDDGIDDSGGTSPSALKHLENSFASTAHHTSGGKPPFQGDLFSEVHGATIEYLEKELDSVRSEKGDLEKHLQELNSQLGTAKSAISEKADEVLSLLNALKLLETEGEGEDLNGLLQENELEFWRRSLTVICNIHAPLTNH